MSACIVNKVIHWWTFWYISLKPLNTHDLVLEIQKTNNKILIAIILKKLNDRVLLLYLTNLFVVPNNLFLLQSNSSNNILVYWFVNFKYSWFSLRNTKSE